MGESWAACTIECKDTGDILGKSIVFKVVTAVIRFLEKSSQVSVSVCGNSIFFKSNFLVPSLLNMSLRLTQLWTLQFFRFTLLHNAGSLEIWCQSLHTLDADTLSLVLKYLNTWSIAKYPALTAFWKLAKSKVVEDRLVFFLTNWLLALAAFD